VVGVSALASVIAYRLIGSPWHITVGAMAGVILAAVLTHDNTAERLSEPAR
jgi:predicted branched-subunit amino acid permease